MNKSDKICRICLKSGACIFLFGSLSDNVCNTELMEKFTAITSIQVTMNDALPKKLCADCAHNLHDAFSLRERALLSNCILNEQYHALEKSNHQVIKVENLNTNESRTPQEDCLKQKENFEELFEEIPAESEYRSDEDDKKLMDIKVELESSDKYLIEKDEFPGKEERDELKCVKRLKSTEKKVYKKSRVKHSRFCEQCDKEFASRKVFQRHMRSVHQDDGFKRPKNMMCDICGSTFFDQSSLDKHSRTHSGDRPYNCDICKQGFIQYTHLERHIISKHKKDKPFQCELCPKRFTFLTNLREHSRTHSGERDHTCSVCGRGFNRRYTMLRHHLTHTLARPYLCLLCPRTYRQTNDLKTHVKRTHPEQPTNKLTDYCIKESVK